MKKLTAILLIFLSLFVFLGNGHRIYAGNGDPKSVVGSVDAKETESDIKKMSDIEEPKNTYIKESTKCENVINKIEKNKESMKLIHVPVIIDNSNFEKIIEKLNAKITNNGDKWKIKIGKKHDKSGYTSYYTRGFPRFSVFYDIHFLLLHKVANLENNDTMDRVIKICNAKYSTVDHISRYHFGSKTELKKSDEKFKNDNNELYKNIYYLSHYYSKKENENNKVKIVILSVFDSDGNEISKYELAEKINYWIDIIMKIDSNAYIIFGIDISNGLTEDNLEERERSATSVVNLTAMAERAYLKKKPNKGQFVGAATFPVCSLKALLNSIIDHESM